MKKRKTVLSLLILAALFLEACASGSAKEPAEYSRSGFYFDTSISIKVYDEQGEALLEKCFSLCDKMERTFSRTREDSELYQVNHRTADQVEVSDELAAVVELGLKYSRMTEGAFDITICPVSELWDFKARQPSLPREEDLDEALKKVDYRAVHLEGNVLKFDRSDTKMDLGAIVKGYAADRLKELLLQEGVESALINLGGNVQTIGTRPDGKPWNVGIQKPFAKSGETIFVAEVTDQSVVCTGVYERCFELDGKRYHHVLDPTTGYPADTDLDQVTIICGESALADVLATCCLILGEERGLDLLEESGFSNTWLHLDDRCVMIEQ